jgi:hypothetical protein
MFRDIWKPIWSKFWGPGSQVRSQIRHRGLEHQSDLSVSVFRDHVSSDALDINDAWRAKRLGDYSATKNINILIWSYVGDCCFRNKMSLLLNSQVRDGTKDYLLEACESRSWLSRWKQIGTKRGTI